MVIQPLISALTEIVATIKPKIMSKLPLKSNKATITGVPQSSVYQQSYSTKPSLIQKAKLAIGNLKSNVKKPVVVTDTVHSV